jgi:hypothetical protein
MAGVTTTSLAAAATDETGRPVAFAEYRGRHWRPRSDHPTKEEPCPVLVHLTDFAASRDGCAPRTRATRRNGSAAWNVRRIADRIGRAEASSRSRSIAIGVGARSHPLIERRGAAPTAAALLEHRCKEALATRRRALLRCAKGGAGQAPEQTLAPRPRQEPGAGPSGRPLSMECHEGGRAEGGPPRRLRLV